MDFILNKFPFLLFVFFSALLTRATTFAQGSKTSNPTVIVALGDSLTEGYGIVKETAYTTLAENILNKEKLNVKILNAGISGSTSASAPSRLKWVLKSKPQIIFIALGANDGLRGVDLKSTKKNLKSTIQIARTNNIKVWLGGMRLPPNYGAQYTSDFYKMYQDLAREENVPLMDFLLAGIAGQTQYFQPDGIHPNEDGHKIMAENFSKFARKNL